MKNLVIVFTGLTSALLTLQYFPAQWVWVFFSFSAICMYLSVSYSQQVPKSLWFNMGVALAVLGSFELYVWLRHSKMLLWYSPEYHVEHPILGYAAQKDHVGTSTRHDNGELTFNVTYTIDASGLRVAPPAQKNSDCILFFGGSFTFGEGVQDEETMPYQVGLKTHGKYRIYNFGFHGYGPHQMLAALEFGLIEEIIQCPPQHVIYQSFAHHVARIAGFPVWGRHGPQYVLKQGKLTYIGRFVDNGIIPDGVYRWLNGSSVFQGILRRRLVKGYIDAREEHVQLFGHIVETARDMLEGRYPGSTFHVVFWDGLNEEEKNTSERMLAALQAKHISVSRISDILPDYEGKKGRYRISVHDEHPNPLAHGLIADYVVRHIIGDAEEMRVSGSPSGKEKNDSRRVSG